MQISVKPHWQGCWWGFVISESDGRRSILGRLLYTNPWNTLIGLFIAIGLGLIYWPLIGLVWIACMVMAPFQVRAFNAKVRRTARYFVS